MKVPVTEVKLSVFKSRYLWCRQTATFYSLAYFLSPLPASKYLLKPHFPESIIRMPLFQIRPEVEWTHSDLVSSATVLSFYCSPGPGQHLHCQPQPPMPPPPLPLSLLLAPGLSPGGAELGQIPPYVCSPTEHFCPDEIMLKQILTASLRRKRSCKRSALRVYLEAHTKEHSMTHHLYISDKGKRRDKVRGFFLLSICFFFYLL